MRIMPLADRNMRESASVILYGTVREGTPGLLRGYPLSTSLWLKYYSTRTVPGQYYDKHYASSKGMPLTDSI